MMPGLSSFSDMDPLLLKMHWSSTFPTFCTKGGVLKYVNIAQTFCLYIEDWRRYVFCVQVNYDLF